ncbi:MULTISPECIES: hypothetical protein [Streptomyces]|uniref:hypothetical protein n=1 Tax=Streptomyces TaxID=1883 RepID=UPI001F1F23A1|nr:hypothetical protein [Streptomyces sp. AMCC400023]
MGAGEFGGQTLQAVRAGATSTRFALRRASFVALSTDNEQGELIAARLAERPADEDAWTALRAAFQVLEEIDMAGEARLEFITLLFGNDSLRAGHAEKQGRWQDLFAPLIEPRLPDSDRRTLQARAVAATAIICMQTANEEWVRLGGRADMFDLYDTAVHAIRRPTTPARWGNEIRASAGASVALR